MSEGISKWLTTVGCGFIGRRPINRLLEEDSSLNIRVLDNLLLSTRFDPAETCDFEERATSGPISWNYSSNTAELIIGDMKDYWNNLESCNGIDIVVHLVASIGTAPPVADPRIDLENNVNGTFNILEASWVANIKKFIFASSGAPLRKVDPPIHSEIFTCEYPE